jgi:hypothetical protein
MTQEWWILLTGQIITVLGLGGVLVWMGKTIKAMKGTVDAQKETIGTLRTILEAADVPKMAERFKAYRELVDHEKEAITKKLAAEFEQEKVKLTSGSKLFVETGQALMRALLDFGTSALPYVPKQQRRDFIERIDVPGTGPVLKEALHRYAEQAPDLSDRGLSFAMRALQDVRDTASRDIPLVLRRSKVPEPPTAPEP